jgi:3-isopropylmalate dehydrogenase
MSTVTVDPIATSANESGLCNAVPGWPSTFDHTLPHVIGVLPGEGIGPEVIDITLEVLEVLAAHGSRRFDIRVGGPIGVPAQQQYGQSLTDDVITFCSDTFSAGGAILCGPGGGRFVYDLRTQFDLYCKLTPLRPFRAMQDTGALRPERTEGIDIVAVRENIGGLYFGSWGSEVQPNGRLLAYQHFSYLEEEVDRILDVSLRLALRRRQRLAVVTKPGGVPAISTLWENRLHHLNKEKNVKTWILEVDNAVYQLIANAHEFDVIVSPNMFGDVLADCGALLLGSRGMSFSGNFGQAGRAVYQTGHGAARDLAGTDRANPIGQILSLAMMLRESFCWQEGAQVIEEAIEETLAKGYRTPDISSPGCQLVGTRELGRRICDTLQDVVSAADLS